MTEWYDFKVKSRVIFFTYQFLDFWNCTIKTNKCSFQFGSKATSCDVLPCISMLFIFSLHKNKLNNNTNNNKYCYYIILI